jgi:hypothetical protein
MAADVIHHFRRKIRRHFLRLLLIVRRHEIPSRPSLLACLRCFARLEESYS